MTERNRHKRIEFGSENSSSTKSRNIRWKIPETARKNIDFSNTNCSENEKEENYIFLQPEFLSTDFIKSLLKKLGGDKIVKGKTKNELMRLFHLQISPKPQRKYKQNRRGKLLSHLQLKREVKLKKKRTSDDFNILNSDLSQNFNSVRKHNATSTNSRLKEPISLIQEGKKTVKLKPVSSFDNIQINKKTTKTAASSDKDAKQIISAVKDTLSNKVVPIRESKSVAIKHKEISHSLIDNSKRKLKLKQDDLSTDQPEEPQKKKPKISWP